MRERAILVTADFESLRHPYQIEDLSAELAELSRSAGLNVLKSLVFKQKTPNAPLFIGKGKAEELGLLVRDQAAQVVVFEASLSSTQQRNLEEILRTKTIDRTQLILDIFAQRARSTEGKLQVELAQMKYLLPRLAGKGIYLSRLGGGVGTRGPGEQKLEMDRRRIRERIVKFSRELLRIEGRRLANIEKKKEKDLPFVALVGYTNAGKSSLFNALTEASVTVKNSLFSTLDTTTRILRLPSNKKALLSDTVGFVRDLPHHLIESFKATLEETVHADLLLHVIDASRRDVADLARAVRLVLADLGADQKKTLMLLNKADLVSRAERQRMEADPLWREALWISSRTGEGLKDLQALIDAEFSGGLSVKQFFIPHEKLSLLSILYEEAQVLKRQSETGGVRVDVRLTMKTEGILRHKLAEPMVGSDRA